MTVVFIEQTLVKGPASGPAIELKIINLYSFILYAGETA